MEKYLLIFAISLLGSTNASAESNQWIQIAESTTGTVWKMRSNDISNGSNQYPRVWVELDHSNDRTVTYRSSKQLLSFDCKNRKSQTLQVIHYMPDGKVVNSWDENYNSYLHKYVAPDTVLEAALNNACPLD